MTTIADLDALIDELTVDAYGDEEQLVGLVAAAYRRWQGRGYLV